MVRRRSCAVSNHENAAILRDAANRPLLRMRKLSVCYAQGTDLHFMALIGRLFVILFGFLAACLVAGMIVVRAVLFPEFSDLGSGPVESGAPNIVLGFCFIFITGVAFLAAMILVSIAKSLCILGSP